MAADPLPVPYNASQLTGYQRNEFDTAKFETGLAFRAASQFDLPSFGLDPDEPIFVTGPYGRGGLSSGYGQQAADFYTRPFRYKNKKIASSLSNKKAKRVCTIFTVLVINARRRAEV